jgi:hypothetical protein
MAPPAPAPVPERPRIPEPDVPPPKPVEKAAAKADSTTQIEMRNVDFRLTEGIVLHVRRMRGALTSTVDSTRIIILGNKHAFALRIYAAETAMTPDDLTHLLNEWVFAYKDAPLTQLRVNIDGAEIRVTGRIALAGGVPFEMRATAAATPDGMIQMHPTSLKAWRVQTKGVMKALGVRIADVLDLRGSRGAMLRGDDLFLDPVRAIPPPRMRGKLAEARIADGQLVLHFVPANDTERRLVARELPRPDRRASNYMMIRGGTLKIARIFIVNAETEMVDANPRDPLDFYLDHYYEQMMAGSSHALPDYGVEYVLPDYHTVSRRAPRLATER